MPGIFFYHSDVKGAGTPGRQPEKRRRVFLVALLLVHPKKCGSHDSHSNISVPGAAS